MKLVERIYKYLDYILDALRRNCFDDKFMNNRSKLSYDGRSTAEKELVM